MSGFDRRRLDDVADQGGRVGEGEELPFGERARAWAAEL